MKDLKGFFEDFQQKRQERFSKQVLKKTLSGQNSDTGRESPRLPFQFRYRAQSVPVYYSSGPEESDVDDNESVYSSRDEYQATSNALPPLDENIDRTVQADEEIGGAGRSDFSNLFSDPEEVEAEKAVSTRPCVTEDTWSPTGTGGLVTRLRAGALSLVDVMEPLPEMDQGGIDSKGNVKSVKAVVYSMEQGKAPAHRRGGAVTYRRQVSCDRCR